MIDNINWYPGHMKKTRELIQENLKMVDAVIEVIDARIPISSRNPIIDELVKSKPRIIVLNKSDLADDKAVKDWAETFRRQGNKALAMNCMSGTGSKELFRLLSSMEAEKNKDKVRQKPYRLMIVGVPNVGKSTFTNRINGASIARTGDRPGVTRSNQWVRITPYLELLDTPGLLWPNLSDQQDARALAFVGTINDNIMDQQMLAIRLMERLMEDHADALTTRFKLKNNALRGVPLLEEACRCRGWLLPGGVCDTDRGAAVILDEFRAGKLGRITLQKAPVQAPKETTPMREAKKEEQTS